MIAYTLNGRRYIVSLILISSLTAQFTLARAQGKKRQPSPAALQEAAQIGHREQETNGIFVDNPKVYDDSSLQLMLNAARARLATIQAIDQTGLLSRIGAISGASL